MTKDVTNDYTANVRKLKSKTVSDIAAEIVSERTEYRPETIENIVRLYQDKVMDNLCEGNIVTDSLGTYTPPPSRVALSVRAALLTLRSTPARSM